MIVPSYIINVKPIFTIKVFMLILSVLSSLLLLEFLSRHFLPPLENFYIQGLGEIDSSYHEEDIESESVPNKGFYLETRTGLRLKPNAKGIIKNHHLSEKDIFLETNSLGYRDNELGETTNHDYRILVLGDSITIGDYVEKEETYPQVIESNLNKAGKGVLYDVINAGVGSIGIETELAILLETGLSTQPDMILIGLYLNDADDSLYSRISKPPRILQKSLAVSYLYKFIDSFKLRAYRVLSKQGRTDNNHDEIIAQKELFAQTNDFSSEDYKTNFMTFNKLVYDSYEDWGFAWSGLFWQKIEKNLKIFKEIADENEIKLVVVLFPVSYQVETKFTDDRPQKDFSKLMTKLNIDFLDLLPLLRQANKGEIDELFFDHAHYTVYGNKYIGGEIAGFISEDIF